DALARPARGLPGVADAVAGIAADLRAPDAEARARRATGRLATLAAAAALAESAPPAIAETYAATRLAAPRETFGANAVGGVAALLLARALP
ncbi:MAG TPA: DNA alkylation response protein, partial [Methylobacterium sp.]|nr:DNA alkylation response protein [Methylobacterium sp.]